MHTQFRMFVWTILVVGGFVATIATWVQSDPASGILVGVVAAGILYGWTVFSAWKWGLSRQVRKHMGKPIDRLTFVSKEVGNSREADYIRALESIAAEQQKSRRLGMQEFAKLSSLKNTNIELARINWDSVEAEDGRLTNLPQNAIYLLQHNQRPFVARLYGDPPIHDFEHEAVVSTGKGKRLELCAHSLEEANEITQWLSGQTAFSSIYRGQMLMVASPQDGSTGQTIRIAKRPDQARERIVLPEKVLQTTERLVDSRLKHAPQLARLGHSANLGVLLHGVPGTGKTLMIRYLISRCTQHTVVVPSDMAVETLRESFRLAQYLQPALMILEDVDLLAQDRQTSRGVDGLQELMNQLDGIPASSDAIVLMSTNRPEVLEPALASRPGRVSQAIEFEVPDAADRERLLRLFFGDVKAEFDFAHWSERTNGASPAFIEELCKRAIIFCLDRLDVDSEEESQLKITNEDMDLAIHELVVMGGALTAKSLGFPTAGS